MPRKRSRRLTLAGLVLAAGLPLAGCGQLIGDGTAPGPPKVARVETPAPDEAQELAYQKAVREALPAGASLLPLPPLGGTGIGIRGAAARVDLDGDKGFELVAAYALPGSPPSAGVMVLREQDGQWEKAWQQEEKPSELDHLQVADLTGDGRPELLVGWRAGASIGSGLNVYTWTEGALKELTSLPYHRLEVTDLDAGYGRDGRAELAVWTKDTGDAMAVEVWRWDGTRLTPAEDLYPAYFPGVVRYYEERVQNMPEAAFYWYYLADARLKAGDPAGALEAAEKGLSLGRGYPEPARFWLVKGRSLTALGRHREAVDALTAAMDGRNLGSKEALEKNMRLPFPAGLLAEAHYYRGEARLGLGDEAGALQDWQEAARLRPEWAKPRQAQERLALAGASGRIINYWREATPENWQARLAGFATWAARQAFPTRGGAAGERPLAVLREAERPEEGLPPVLLVDWGGNPGTGVDGHLILWWRDGQMHAQALYSLDAAAHGLGQNRAVLAARLAPGPQGPQLGVVYDEASGGSGSPRPVFYLWELREDKWRVAWRSDADHQWRNSHGSLRFTGPGLAEFTMESDSWQAGDGKDRIFHESNPGPHRRFLDTWRFAGGAYRRRESVTRPSAYATLVELVYDLSTGREEEARALLADPALLDEAVALGLVQVPLGQEWLLELNDPAAERSGPLTILDGPAAGVTVEFGERNGQWLVTGFARDDRPASR